MAKDKKPKLDPHVVELTKATYIEELDKSNGYLDIGGVGVEERCVIRHMEWAKCNREEAQKAFNESSLFYINYVTRVLKVLTERGEYPPKSKRALPEKYDIDPDYVFNLCIDCNEDRIGGREKFIKSHMKKNKSTRERAEKRFKEVSQNYAPIVRSVLKALIQFNEVPKRAIKARVK